MLGVVPANVGVMERAAGGFGVNRQSMSGLLTSPVDSIDQAVLRYGVEEADKVIVGRMESDFGGSLGKVTVEVAPRLWDGGCGKRCCRMMSSARLVMRRRLPLME